MPRPACPIAFPAPSTAGSAALVRTPRRGPWLTSLRLTCVLVASLLAISGNQAWAQSNPSQSADGTAPADTAAREDAPPEDDGLVKPSCRPRPPVTVSPASGSASGGTLVKVNADGLGSCEKISVIVGGVPALISSRSGDTLLVMTGASAAGTVDVVITGADTNGNVISVAGKGAYTYVAGPGTPVVTTDSQRLATVQGSVTQAIGGVGAAAMSSAISADIAEGLGGSGGTSGGPPASPSAVPGLAAFGFAQPYALGAGVPSTRRTATPAETGRTGAVGGLLGGWKPWLSVMGSGWDERARDASGAGIEGTQVNATLGLRRIVVPGLLVGAVAGYERFDYEVTGLDGKVTGDGWTAGAYLGWALTKDLRLDLAGAGTAVVYNAAAGAASGSFDAQRWMVTTGVSGEYELAGFLLEPSTRLFALTERQNDWTDTIGGRHDERTTSFGRSSTGARLRFPIALSGSANVTSYVGLYGDYRFVNDVPLSAAQPVLGIRDGWSGRATAGVAATVGDTRLSLDGEYGGIGDDTFSVWSVTGRGAVPF